MGKLTKEDVIKHLNDTCTLMECLLEGYKREIKRVISDNDCIGNIDFDFNATCVRVSNDLIKFHCENIGLFNEELDNIYGRILKRFSEGIEECKEYRLNLKVEKKKESIEPKKTSELKIYRLWVGKDDKLWVNTRDEWDPCVICQGHGTYIGVDTPETRRYDTGKFGYFTGRSITRLEHVQKEIGVYACDDGNGIVEMITGKPVKTWDEEKSPVYDFDKYVYCDHMSAGLTEIKLKTSEELSFVNADDKRIKQFETRLIAHEEKTLLDRIKDAKKLEQERQAKEYLKDYNVPRR